MQTAIARLTTEREIKVGIPDTLETSLVSGTLFIVQPGSGVTGPKILLSPTAALKEGLLTELPEKEVA